MPSARPRSNFRMTFFDWAHLTRATLVLAIFALCGALVPAAISQVKESHPPSTSTSRSIQIQLDREGSKVESEIAIVEQQICRVDLRFHYRSPDERSRVFELAGSPARDRDGNLVQSGVKVPLHISVSRIVGADREELLTSKRTETVSIEGAGTDYVRRTVTSIAVVPGRYRFLAKNEMAHPEFSGINAQLVVLCFSTLR